MNCSIIQLTMNFNKKDTLEEIVNGKKVRGRRRYEMIDNIKINGLYTDKKWMAEKRVEWNMLSLQ